MSITLLAIFGSIAFLYFAKSVCTPIVLSVFLYFLLDPLVTKLECKYFPRALISPLFVILVVILIAAGAWVTVITTAEITSHFPEYAAKAKSVTDFLMKGAEKLSANTPQLFPQPQEPIQKVEIVRSVSDITSYIVKWLDVIVEAVGSIFMVPIITLFFLIERNRISKKLKALPLFSRSGKEIAIKITLVVQAFFLGNLVAGFLSTLCFFAAFAIIGLENKIPLSIGAGFLNLFPIVGAFLAMIFPVAQGLLQFDNIGPFLTIVISSLLIHLGMSNFVLPKLMGSRVDVNVIAATLGMLFWGWLWGALGIFLAVPLLAIIKVICDVIPQAKPIAIVLSETTSQAKSVVLAKSIESVQT